MGWTTACHSFVLPQQPFCYSQGREEQNEIAGKYGDLHKSGFRDDVGERFGGAEKGVYFSKGGEKIGAMQEETGDAPAGRPDGIVVLAVLFAFDTFEFGF